MVRMTILRKAKESDWNRIAALLQSAGLHPVLAYYDGSGVPHPLNPEETFLRASGLMVPVTTSFAIYVPEGETEDSEEILKDARRDRPEAEAGN